MTFVEKIINSYKTLRKTQENCEKYHVCGEDSMFINVNCPKMNLTIQYNPNQEIFTGIIKLDFRMEEM